MNRFSRNVALSLVIVGIAALVLPFACVKAQTLRFTPGKCDWNLNRKAFDNYIGDGHAGGFTLPRYQHHIISASLSTGAAYGLRKLGLPRWAAATVAVVGVGIVPHVRGYVHGRYDINAQDWIADAWIRSAPAWYAIGHGGDHSKKSHALAATTFLAGYGAVACWASP